LELGLGRDLTLFEQCEKGAREQGDMVHVLAELGTTGLELGYTRVSG
jgi:hypothetical protein